MTYAQKRAKFYDGLYSCPPPPVPCAYWKVEDWIAFIDSDGEWL